MALSTSPSNDLLRALQEARHAQETVERPPPPVSLPPLMKWIEECDPTWKSPHHLSELVEVLECAPRGGLRIMVGCPIRHYKTCTVLSGVAWWIRRDPTLRVIYMTYSIGRAVEIGKELRDLCKRMGVVVDRGYDTIASWRTETGGGVDVMSAQQSRLGADVDILIVDDPFESDVECDRPEVREAVDRTIEHYTMRLSRGGSCVLVMSRFHVDDAIGRRLNRTAERWTYVHKRAVEEDEHGVEHALAPSVRTVEEMRAIRAALQETDPTERLWWAQWQNEPKPIGSDLFRDATYYDHMPDWTFRIGYGADLAFTSGASSDWAAFVAGKVCGTKAYILEVQRHKLDAHLIESTAKAMLDRYGHGPIYSYMSGPEVGMARLMRERGLPFVVMPARYNKLVRAQRTITRWNDGQVAVPSSAPWLHGFLHRVSCFRGNDHDEGDDEVDALVSFCDGALGGAAMGGVKTLGKSYPGFGVR